MRVVPRRIRVNGDFYKPVYESDEKTRKYHRKDGRSLLESDSYNGLEKLGQLSSMVGKLHSPGLRVNRILNKPDMTYTVYINNDDDKWIGFAEYDASRLVQKLTLGITILGPGRNDSTDIVTSTTNTEDLEVVVDVINAFVKGLPKEMSEGEEDLTRSIPSLTSLLSDDNLDAFKDKTDSIKRHLKYLLRDYIVYH